MYISNGCHDGSTCIVLSSNNGFVTEHSMHFYACLIGQHNISLLPLFFVSCLCYAQKDFTEIVKFNFNLIKINISCVTHVVLIAFCNIVFMLVAFILNHTSYVLITTSTSSAHNRVHMSKIVPIIIII